MSALTGSPRDEKRPAQEVHARQGRRRRLDTAGEWAHTGGDQPHRAQLTLQPHR
jgi:hypothetical protein